MNKNRKSSTGKHGAAKSRSRKKKSITMGPSKMPGGIEHHREYCSCPPCVSRRIENPEGEKIPFSLRLPVEMIESIKREAGIQNKPLSVLVAGWIEKGLREALEGA